VGKNHSQWMSGQGAVKIARIGKCSAKSSQKLPNAEIISGKMASNLLGNGLNPSETFKNQMKKKRICSLKRNVVCFIDSLYRTLP